MSPEASKSRMPRISLDFLDSSPWPISILDIFLNINQTEFLTYVTGPHLSERHILVCEFWKILTWDRLSIENVGHVEYLKSRGLILSEATFPLWELFLLNMPRLSRVCRQMSGAVCSEESGASSCRALGVYTLAATFGHRWEAPEYTWNMKMCLMSM